MRRLTCVSLMLATNWVILITAPVRADEREDFFEAKIRPVLVETCFRCHGDVKSGGTLRVDSRDALVRGGESGAAIVPGKPEESLLIKAIQRQDDVSAMPPEKSKALRPGQVADFVTWIQQGAVWPAKSAAFKATKHWALEPIRDSMPPAVRDTSWVKTGIDSFIRARQETAGLAPSPLADKLTLIRRATFDLTGLPPTPEAVEAFLQDSTPHAFQTVVDRLLKSPAYGERWGRHWLDVVRYADTAGETADYPVPLAWRYRNYVIEAFNTDKPYDQFLTEQIAGDVLASQGGPKQYAERTIATGFLAISRRFGFDSENYHHLTIQDTIDTLGQTVLGLSLGCARCHDHKFDPVTMQDYYGLYGIFDSSRYAFPGSEQKQKVRSLVPLIPLQESQPQWRKFDERVATILSSLERQKQPVPSAILKSLNDLDGDFELQAAAAGGSNGVLVPPWVYTGKIAVTQSAQSPYKNLYPRGKVGASVPGGIGEYSIKQALHPQRSPTNCSHLYINLDFRVSAPDPKLNGAHRFWLGSLPATPAIEVLISSVDAKIKIVGQTDIVIPLKPNQWHNIQFTLDLNNQKVSGTVGMPGQLSEFRTDFSGLQSASVINVVGFDSGVGTDTATLPAIEFDNLGVQETPIATVSTEIPIPVQPDGQLDPLALTKELEQLTGFDGDFELQNKDGAPANPWGPGPNSVVKISTDSQSPYGNLYGRGNLGIHMPNRAEYDGFGRVLSNVKPNADDCLSASFDFRCAGQDAGGGGSWRYYLGHGPGNSAAVELFFNGSQFFRRSGDARDAIAPLVIGEWYQVQFTLNLKARTYVGKLISRSTHQDFSGQVATGWDGTIDYTFIDSYGHLGGIRPALDADNFHLNSNPLPSLDATPIQMAVETLEARRAKVAEIRHQLVSLQQNAELEKHELNRLLVEGPCPLTYGMAEGTPHNVRIQIRGEPDQPGTEVPRGFIRVLGGTSIPAETAGSGRLELAQWLTRPDNPLTARVMVNRIWQYHFGRGLVKTPNDFGVRGVPPTHPELLDYLATQFIRQGWSVKAMHRLIMSSAVYQQASLSAESQNKAGQPATDPVENADLYVSFPRRRLSAEEIRDSILAVSGELDAVPGTEHPFPAPVNWGYSQHGPFSAVYDHNKRSVYLMTQRLKRHPFLALFDGADPNASTAERLGTTVPTQALFFLNDPFIHAKAEKWAARLVAARPDDSQRIELAWREALGRMPTAVERQEALEFLTNYRTELAATQQNNLEVRALAALMRTLFGSNEFLHLD